MNTKGKAGYVPYPSLFKIIQIEFCEINKIVEKTNKHTANGGVCVCV
jgi:hypothetical protein